MNGRRLLPAILLLAICVLGLFLYKRSSNSINGERSTEQATNVNNKQHVAYNNSAIRRTLFVPYWQLNGQNQESEIKNQNYDRYVYFGVAGTADGIPTDDPGFEHIDGFMRMAGGSRWLTIRMTDSEANDVVLNNKSSQLKILNDSVRIAKENGFDGVVLDFEFNSMFGGSVEKVTSFYQLFGEGVRSKKLKFAAALYGDVFYRKRPYDLAEITKYSDEIMIMAYDLHKSRGEPGPNFPLSAGKNYGYGYDLLLKDLEQLVSMDKVTVIFGMYGYDWKVDEQKRPITQGSALTTAQILSEYIGRCDSLHCVKINDPVSAETEIDYVGEDGRYHIIWFETEESTKKKEEYLKQRGVASVAYWAYGYF